MRSDVRIGIVGTGRIGTLLCRVLANRAPAAEIVLAGRSRDRCEALKQEIPSLEIATPNVVARDVDMLVLALPAEAYPAYLRTIADTLRSGCIVISLSNGMALRALGEVVPNPIVKVIPTLAHRVGRGVSLVMAGPRAEAQHLTRVTELLSAFSRPIQVDERDARVASNVAGAFLAIAAAFTDAFVMENVGRASVLNRVQLEAMAAEALGAVADLSAAGHSLAEIAATTATPGGPTEAALSALARHAEELCAEIVDATFRNQSTQRALTGSASGDPP